MSNPTASRRSRENIASHCALTATVASIAFIACPTSARSEKSPPEKPWHASVGASAAVGARGSDEPTGRADLRLELGAAWTQTASRLLEPTDPDEWSLFIFHTVNPNEVEGVGGELRVHARGTGPANREFGVVLEQRAFAQLAGWNATQFANLSRPADFDNTFWRSGRDQLELGVDLSLPPMWGVGDPTRLTLSAGAMRVAYAELIATGDPSTQQFDLDIELVGAALRHPRFLLELFSFRYREWGVPTARQGDVVRGQSVGAFDLDMARLDLNLGDVTLHATGGFMFAFALATFESNVGPNGGSSRSAGEPVVAPVLWAGAVVRRDRFELAVGGGSATRISPDALAVDAGARAELSGTVRFEVAARKVSSTLEVDGAILRRQDVSDMAPAGIEPVGSLLLLGRLTAGVDVEVSKRLNLGAQVYGEHSDRDDPRLHASEPGTIATSFGVELSATMPLGN